MWIKRKTRLVLFGLLSLTLFPVCTQTFAKDLKTLYWDKTTAAERKKCARDPNCFILEDPDKKIARSKCPKDKPKCYLRNGWDELNADNFHMAEILAQYGTYYDHDQYSDEIWLESSNLLAMIYIRQGKYDVADKQLKFALSLNDLKRRKEITKASKHPLNKIHQLQTLQILAYLYTETGRYDDADRVYDKIETMAHKLQGKANVDIENILLSKKYLKERLHDPNAAKRIYQQYLRIMD